MLKPPISRESLKKISRVSKASLARALPSMRRSLQLLKVIIARELLNNLLNLRFVMGLVLCVVVTVACMAVLTHDYRQELADYNDRVNMQDDFLSNYAAGKVSAAHRGHCPRQRFGFV